MIHLLFGSVVASASFIIEKQIRKAKEAHHFIKETIHNERIELEDLKKKYIGLLQERKKPEDQ